MPYIVTTRQTLPARWLDGLDPEAREYAEVFEAPEPETISVSCRAVATLDEAWMKLPSGIADTTLVRERFALEEHGHCSFGPLPDGTVIEVERVKWEDLQNGDPWFYGAYSDVPASIAETVLDAYNAAQ